MRPSARRQLSRCVRSPSTSFPADCADSVRTATHATLTTGVGPRHEYLSMAQSVGRVGCADRFDATAMAADALGGAVLNLNFTRRCTEHPSALVGDDASCPTHWVVPPDVQFSCSIWQDAPLRHLTISRLMVVSCDAAHTCGVMSARRFGCSRCPELNQK